MTLFRRLTLVIRDSVVEYALYPIFPPNEHAQQVLAWLRSHPWHLDAGSGAGRRGGAAEPVGPVADVVE